MFENILAQAHADQRRAGEPTIPPADESRITAIKKAVEQKWAVQLPLGYIQFLRICNGLDYNGLTIYGIDHSPENRGPVGFWQGLLAANALWHEAENKRKYLIFGDTGEEFYALEMLSGEWIQRDRVGGDIIDHFSSFDAMIETAISDRL